MAQRCAIDSITASVVQGALENIAVEMGYKLMRMSYSSIIRESEDFGAALVDSNGRELAESGCLAALSGVSASSSSAGQISMTSRSPMTSSFDQWMTSGSMSCQKMASASSLVEAS